MVIVAFLFFKIENRLCLVFMTNYIEVKAKVKSKDMGQCWIALVSSKLMEGLMTCM